MYEPCCADERSAYGLGVAIGHSRYRYDTTDVISLGHSGGGDGFLADMYWYTALDLGIAMLTNSDGHELQLGLVDSIAQDVFAAYLGKKTRPGAVPARSGRRPIAVDEARLRQLAGVYLGARDVVFAIQDGRLCWKTRSECVPVDFHTADEIAINRPTLALSCKFQKDGQRDPAAAACTIDVGPMRVSGTMPFNGSPYDPQGPDDPGWQAHLGDYEIWQWGKLAETISLRVINGHLYFGRYRVVQEYQPGLFFLADGEALDLRTTTPTYRNIALTRRTGAGP
jgi:hypothetical protein